MKRSVIVVGNGLGMALDSEYFSLAKGLETVWHSTVSLSEQQKNLVNSAMPKRLSMDYPSSEDELDELQLAIVVSEWLKDFESSNVKWLSDESRKLSRAFKHFVHEVGFYFHESKKTLPAQFVSNLAQFIIKTKSHVATLNYDNLLYDAFLNSDYKYDLLYNYEGSLIDGFLKDGFASKNLNRLPKKVPKLGWYLHLHGSPLFIGNKKLTGEKRKDRNLTEKSHIVLTHVNHKRFIIESSEILSAYWNKFNEALDEAETVILFGYSGCDTHLNEKIRLRCQKNPVHIIEWHGGKDLSSRQKHWNQNLKGCNVSVKQLDNILDFYDWHSLCPA